MDIRDYERLTHSDVVGLSFIRADTPFIFRRNYRSGLRSHIMAVLRPEDVALESQGVLVGGVRTYPRPRPVKMLRIFRRRFKDLSEAQEELKGVKLIEGYLGPEYMARSDEFLAELETDEGPSLVLCGLQEYVEGEILDPWGCLTDECLGHLLLRTYEPAKSGELRILIETIRWRAGVFADRVKTMALEAGRIPDLAGVGNILLTTSAEIKLVDINNVSRIGFGSRVSLDDRGYPVCDKSVQALAKIEQFLARKSISTSDPLYSVYLDPARMEMVKGLEWEFHNSHSGDFPFTGAQ